MASKVKTRNILEIMSAVLGMFLAMDVKGFNLIHAVLYAYRFLRSVRGGKEGKPEGDNPSQHDPRERGRKNRGIGGYGRNVDENTIVDLVQAGFLIFWHSQRGRNGLPAENLTTSQAMGLAVSKWYKREKRNLRITTDRKAIDARMRKAFAHAEEVIELLPVEMHGKVREALLYLAAGKDKKETARAMGMSRPTLYALLAKVKATRTARIVQDERKPQPMPIPQAGWYNAQQGLWCITTAYDLPIPATDEPIRFDDTAMFDGRLPERQDGSPDPRTCLAADGIIRHGRLLRSGFLSPLPLAAGEDTPFLAWEGDNTDGAGI